MVEVNIWGAFAAIGLTHDITQDPYGLIFDEEKFRQSPGFLELWQRDVPFESLSTRRQQARFGWINKSEQIDLVDIFYFFDVGEQRYETKYFTEKVAFWIDQPNILFC
jgi:hypothetical protein